MAILTEPLAPRQRQAKFCVDLMPATVPITQAAVTVVDAEDDDDDVRLAFDPWTKKDYADSTPSAAAPSAVAISRPPRPIIESLADGPLFMWDRRALRFKKMQCSISPDVHGVWCLRGPGLRVPLASICMVHITKQSRLQFRVSRFGESHLTFRVPALPLGLLHYWVATLQTLSLQACAVVSPVVWSGEWAATRVQARWRGVRGRMRRAQRLAARRNAAEEQRGAVEAAEAAESARVQSDLANAVAEAEAAAAEAAQRAYAAADDADQAHAAAEMAVAERRARDAPRRECS